jgi:hypothetical protein
VTFRTELLDNLAEVREHNATNSATPRIDTVRNRIRGTVALLEAIDDELTDLHVLATDRAAARRDAVVSGGERDYALDNHGNPLARRLLAELELAALDVSDIVDDVVHDCLRLLRAGEIGGRRTRPTASLEEVALAIGAQRKRMALGQYTPVRVEAQPNAEQAAKVVRTEDLVRERDRWKRRAESLQARLDRRNPHGARRRPVA